MWPAQLLGGTRHVHPDWVPPGTQLRPWGEPWPSPSSRCPRAWRHLAPRRLEHPGAGSQASLYSEHTHPRLAPKSSATETHIARPGRHLYQGNFCRCFLFIPQDVTPGISAIGKVETGAHWWLSLVLCLLTPETGSTMVLRTGLSSSHIAPKPDAQISVSQLDQGL